MRAMRERFLRLVAAGSVATGGGVGAWRARSVGWAAGGLLALLAGALALQVGQALLADAALRLGVLASLVAGLATAVGAVPVLAMRRLSSRAEQGLTGFSGGVMLAAAVFALLLPALEHGGAAFGAPAGFALAVAGVALGAAALKAADRALPHLHLPVAAGGSERGAWLVVGAIGLHNFPEGFAVGAGFGGDPALGWTTALAIGAQNVPEGLVVAAAVAGMGFSRLAAIAVAGLTGLFEPVGALAGGVLAGFAPALLPLALAVAAGAMLFVVLHEVFPVLRRHGGAAAWTAVAAGGVTMFLLDAVLA